MATTGEAWEDWALYVGLTCDAADGLALDDESGMDGKISLHRCLK